MQIKHGFGYRCHNLIDLFDKTNTMSAFMRKLEKQSLIDPLSYDSNKYKGDGFEFLVEILIKSHAYDNRIGITNYEPVLSDDNGVDGTGVNLIGDKCVVQIKYRSKKDSVLSANQDSLTNMISDGMIKHDVVIDKLNKKCSRHYIFTTAEGLHHYTDNENFKGFVHCIGYKQLKSMLDNNLSFWNLCRDISRKIMESKTKSVNL